MWTSGYLHALYDQYLLPEKLKDDVILTFYIYDWHDFFPAYFNDIVVGAVCCRIDTSDNQRRLYIMTLGCLAPYRRLSIGMEL